MRNRNFHTLLFFFISLQVCFSQSNKHIVYFIDKVGSNYSVNEPSEFLSSRAIERRNAQNIAIIENDIPVNANYIQGVISTGATILAKTKWLNAILIEGTDEELNLVLQLSFVKKTLKVGKSGVSVESLNFIKEDSLPYGISASQNNLIGVDNMHRMGFHGEGMLIAVLDNGFKFVNQHPVFHKIISENLLSTYDFVHRESDVFDDGTHGTMVLSVLAGYSENYLIGPAFESEFILLKTEDDQAEMMTEEVFWVAGAEYADSAGVDVINSSLGYNTFDDPVLNHQISQLDGNTSIISQGADLAASKGIIVVNSAGNEGGNSWNKIIFPADADSILAVGAVNLHGVYASFSSKGNTSDGRIKPDVSAQGLGVVVASGSQSYAYANGTSFSAPLIAGLVAGIWQAHRSFSNMEIIEVLRITASQSEKPDSLLGFGIANFERADLYLTRLENAKGSFIFAPNPVDEVEPVLILQENALNKIINLSLFDSKGKHVFSEQFTPGKRIITLDFNFNNLNPGIYYCQLQSDDFLYTTRLLVK